MWRFKTRRIKSWVFHSIVVCLEALLKDETKPASRHLERRFPWLHPGLVTLCGHTLSQKGEIDDLGDVITSTLFKVVTPGLPAVSLITPFPGQTRLCHTLSPYEIIKRLHWLMLFKSCYLESTTRPLIMPILGKFFLWQRIFAQSSYQQKFYNIQYSGNTLQLDLVLYLTWIARFTRTENQSEMVVVMPSVEVVK